MSKPCETCLDLDSRMKSTEDDYVWNNLLARLETHRAEVHALKEDEVERD